MDNEINNNPRKRFQFEFRCLVDNAYEVLSSMKEVNAFLLFEDEKIIQVSLYHRQKPEFWKRFSWIQNVQPWDYTGPISDLRYPPEDNALYFNFDEPVFNTPRRLRPTSESQASKAHKHDKYDDMIFSKPVEVLSEPKQVSQSPVQKVSTGPSSTIPSDSWSVIAEQQNSFLSELKETLKQVSTPMKIVEPVIQVKPKTKFDERAKRIEFSKKIMEGMSVQSLHNYLYEEGQVSEYHLFLKEMPSLQTFANFIYKKTPANESSSKPYFGEEPRKKFKQENSNALVIAPTNTNNLNLATTLQTLVVEECKSNHEENQPAVKLEEGRNGHQEEGSNEGQYSHWEKVQELSKFLISSDFPVWSKLDYNVREEQIE